VIHAPYLDFLDSVPMRALLDLVMEITDLAQQYRNVDQSCVVAVGYRCVPPGETAQSVICHSF